DSGVRGRSSHIAPPLAILKLRPSSFGPRSIVNYHFLRLREATADGEPSGGSEASPWERAVQLRVLSQIFLLLGRWDDAATIIDELEPLATRFADSPPSHVSPSTEPWRVFG